MALKIKFTFNRRDVVIYPGKPASEQDYPTNPNLDKYQLAAVYFAAKAAASRKMNSICLRVPGRYEYNQAITRTMLVEFLAYVQDMEGAHPDLNVDVFNNTLKAIEDRGWLSVVDDGWISG